MPSRTLAEATRRISRLSTSVIQKLAIVDDTAVTKLRGLVDAYQAAQTAAALAAKKFTEDASLLPGTGGDAWKELFEAARKFSVSVKRGAARPVIDATKRAGQFARLG